MRNAGSQSWTRRQKTRLEPTGSNVRSEENCVLTSRESVECDAHVSYKFHSVDVNSRLVTTLVVLLNCLTVIFLRI